MTQPLLLVEDAQSLSMLYSQNLRRDGYQVNCAFSLSEARAALEPELPAMVLLDMQLPDGNGLDFLKEMRAAAPGMPVIVVTANGSINLAVQAMREGASDFLVKPFDESRLLNAVHNALASAPPAPVPEASAADEGTGFEGFVGQSPEMTGIYRMVGSISRSTATVFITGESGTGKDVCARAIHARSTRSRKAFVPLNCAAIPRDLLESEVFGHLKGAFTGALSDKPGAAAVADGGTLFLDEVCEMDLSLQTKLLRFLQTSTIQPVGAARPVPVDVRIVCATNRDPMEEVKAGRFREDLYYRLHVVPIHMPPLRGRPGDIMEIADASLAEFSEEEGKSFVGFDTEAARTLTGHDWPGNVRQLLNVIRNIVVLNDGPLVTPSMFPNELVLSATVSESVYSINPVTGPTSVPLPAAAANHRVAGLLGMPLAEIEREVIEATIAHCGGSIPRAARTLQVSPSTLYRKIENWSGDGRRRA